MRFIQAYAAEGVPLWGVTVQNEPMATQRWDSCLYSAEEERDFVRDHLGPTLAGAGLGHVKIIVWTQGWIDWNLMLDETGGPNHVGNLCSAALLVDRARSVRLPQSSYFYLGHFARFIRPGAQRILCASSAQAIECTAFVNPDGSQALVALNRSDNEQRAQVRWDGRCASMVLPPHAIPTAVRPA